MLHRTIGERIASHSWKEYFHTNDVYLCIGYATSGARLDTSPARLDTSPLGSATINNLQQLHNESGETQVTWLSYIWHLGSVTSDWDATSMIATHSYKCLFVHRLSYKQLECNKYLHGSVTRYTTPVLVFLGFLVGENIPSFQEAIHTILQMRGLPNQGDWLHHILCYTHFNVMIEYSLSSIEWYQLYDWSGEEFNILSAF